MNNPPYWTKQGQDQSQLDRIERKLDLLIAALAEEEEPATITDLDGRTYEFGERDQSQPL